MINSGKKCRRLKSHFKAGVVFCLSSFLLGAMFDPASAQETAMRNGFDPNSPLAEGPIAKNLKKVKRNAQSNTSAPTTSDRYTTETVSDADQQAEALERLLSNDVVEPGQSDEAKPQSTGLSDNETEATSDSVLSGGATGKNTKKSLKAKISTAANSKTTLDPGLDAETTGALVVRKGQRAQMLRAQPAIAAEAVQSRDLTEEENPFKAVGIRFGSMTLRPAIEQGLETTTNQTASTGGTSATSSITTFRLDGASDWRNGSLETTGFVTLRRGLSGDANFDPESGASFKLTQPVLREWSFSLGGAYGLKRESAVNGSTFPTTITSRPLAQNVKLSAGIGKIEGFFQPSALFEYDRLSYGNATNSSGVTISQSDRDQTTLRGTFRLGMEVSPAFTPFGEVAYGNTWRDETVDVFGNNRSSHDLRASVGAEINLSEKLNGQFSIGWLRQSFESTILEDIEGVALAAAINWSPVQGTILSAGLTTNAEPSNSSTISGSLVYAGTLGLTHQLSSRLSTTATLGASYRDFTGSGGHDTTLSAELAATYMVNRMLGVNAKLRQESVSSSDAMRGSDTTTVMLGLRIQR